MRRIEKIIFQNKYGKLKETCDESGNDITYVIEWTEKTFHNEVYRKYTNALQEWAWRNNFMEKTK